MISYHATPLVLVMITGLTLVQSRTIKVVNNCASTVWPGMYTGGTKAPDQVTGWGLKSKAFTEFQVADDWTAGRVWARTGCTVQDGKFQCLTGACGQGQAGDMTCQVTNQPPATLAEFTLASEGMDHYDISLVDGESNSDKNLRAGFNIPMNIYPTLPECVRPSCMVNINPLCPPTLRSGIDQDGKNLGCLAACNAGYGQETFGNRACCSGGYNDPDLCAICGVDYYPLFKDNCPSSYAYAYDEKSKTALFTCPSAPGKLSNYIIEFCPNGTSYVGTTTPDPKYLNATATCSNKLTAWSTSFSVGPSPTKTATKGTLKVIATVAPGIDGAAALQIGGIDPAYSVVDADKAISGESGGMLTYSGGGGGSTSGQGRPTSSGSGLVYSSYTASPTSSRSVGNQGGAHASKVTKVFTEVDGTTILQITESTDGPVNDGGGRHGHRKGKCKGGQWLHGVPYRQQNRKRGNKQLRSE